MREVLLKNFTAFGLGGKARVSNVFSVADALQLSGEVVLGGGTNVLIGNENLPEFALNMIKGIDFSGEEGYVGSGERLSKVCLLAAKQSLSGLEWAVGLPGSVGGAIKGNAGAMNRSVSDIVKYVDIVRDGKKMRLDKSDCAFSYRGSGFGISDVIVGAGLLLPRADASVIRENTARTMEKRRAQPKGRTAGCVFKNPLPLSAGKIIDECGLKGKRVGGASVSCKHANFIVLGGEATFSDVVTLIELVEKRVFSEKGIVLEREIKIYGDV